MIDLSRSTLKAALLISLASQPLAFAESGSDDQLLEGERLEFFGGDAETYVVLDNEGQLKLMGLSIAMNSLANASDYDNQSFKLRFPEQVAATSYINHVGIDWNLMGHPPMDVYTTAHFDIHFYGLSMDEVAKIDCVEQQNIDPNLVPEGYVLPPADAPDACVPQMGVHALPLTDLAEGYKFSETMIYGYYGNQMVFIEPMITQSFFLEKRSVSKSLIYTEEQLAAVGDRALPQHYSVYFDELTERYLIEFTAFTTR